MIKGNNLLSNFFILGAVTESRCNGIVVILVLRFLPNLSKKYHHKESIYCSEVFTIRHSFWVFEKTCFFPYFRKLSTPPPPWFRHYYKIIFIIFRCLTLQKVSSSRLERKIFRQKKKLFVFPNHAPQTPKHHPLKILIYMYDLCHNNRTRIYKRIWI